MNIADKHCVPCEGGTLPLSSEEEQKQMQAISSQWVLLTDGVHKLRKQFQFKNFRQAMDFVNIVADIAESEGHHPDVYIFYNKVQIELFTHAAGGLSENDFIMAAKIDTSVPSNAK